MRRVSSPEVALAKYGETPRKLDDALERKARGDRGCLFDLLSLFGILTLFTCLVTSQLGLIAFSWTYLGAAIWVGGYFLGLGAQNRSGRERRIALEGGSLVHARVIRCTPHLREGGNKRAGRAVLVYSLEPDTRHDAGALRELAEALAELPGPSKTQDPHSDDQRLARVLHDDFCFETVQLDAVKLRGQDARPRPAYVSRVGVNPSELDAPLSGDGSVLALIVDPPRNFAEMV